MKEGFTLKCISIRQAVCHCTSVSPTGLLENHMGSLVRMQTQGLAAGLLNQSPCEQNLEICIFNWLSRPFFYQLVYEKKVKVKSLGHVQLFATPWTVAYQAPQSMEFSRQEYWSGLPFPSPGDLDPGIESRSPTLQADALPSEPPVKPYMK